MTFTRQQTRTARKAHRCDACNRTIDAGETYANGAGTSYDWDGISTWKMCAHCQRTYQLFGDGIGPDRVGWCYDSFQEWIHGGAYSYDELKAQVGWRMKWRRRYSGALLPIPTVTS